MKKVTQFINETHPRLSNLMISNQAIETIKDSLKKIDLFAQHLSDYRITKFSQGILYLSVSSAAFATQIRHSSTLILKSLRERISDVEFNAIQCKVGIITSTARKEVAYKRNTPKMITEKTKIKLSQLSEKINSNELKNALKRLTD